MSKRKKIKTPLYTRRVNTPAFELLPKSKHSRMNGVHTYKASCFSNKLKGYKSLKTGEDNTDFGHVLIGKLYGYEGHITIKVSDTGIYYTREKMGLSAIDGFKYHAKIICDFTCNDDKTRWMAPITNSVNLCVGNEPLHFFVMEYIDKGDWGEYIERLDRNELCSIITQIMYCFIELGQRYKIYHGDIHSANILVDSTDDEYSIHIVNGEEIRVKTFGKMPKLIDFGRCGKFYDKSPTCAEIIYELMIAVSVCMYYIKNESIKNKINVILLKQETEFNSIGAFVQSIIDSFI